MSTEPVILTALRDGQVKYLKTRDGAARTLEVCRGLLAYLASIWTLHVPGTICVIDRC